MKTKPPLRWYSFRWQVGLVLALASVAIWHYFVGRFRHPIGAGPAGPKVEERAFQKPWSAGQFVLIGFGDSVTAGYGAAPGHGYFDLLVTNDDQAFPEMKGRDLRQVLPGLKADNYSVSYTVSEEHLKEQLPRIRTYPPEVRGLVVLTTGGNDLIHDYGRSPPRDGALYGCTAAQAEGWKANFRARLLAILTGLRSKFPGGCDIFLANIYDPTDGVGDVERAHYGLPAWPGGLRAVALFNEVIAEACRAVPDVHLVDMHALFLGHGIHCSDPRNPHHDASDPHYWYFENLEDPNERGYDALRRLFLLEIGKRFTSP